MTGYLNEVLRKSIHLSSLWMTIAIWYLDQQSALLLFGFLFLGMFACELLRTRWQPFSGIYNKFFGRILRAHENKQFTGAFYVLLSAFLAVLLFEKTIAVTALAIMLVSDSMAALVGKKFGKTPLAGKSLEGSLAFFISALAVLFVTGHFSIYGIVSALAGTIAELFGKKIKIDDNLTITLVTGFALTIFGAIRL